MKKLGFLLLLFVSFGFVLQSCDDTETYAEKKEKERRWIKNYIEKVLHSFKNVTWYIATVLSVLAYLYFFEMRYERLMMFNLVAILFCLSIVFLSCKIKINSPVLRWCGNNLFWIYILQRIPMKALSDIGLSTTHTNIYIILCMIITIPLAMGVKYLSSKLQNIILK